MILQIDKSVFSFCDLVFKDLNPKPMKINCFLFLSRLHCVLGSKYHKALL